MKSIGTSVLSVLDLSGNLVCCLGILLGFSCLFSGTGFPITHSGAENDLTFPVLTLLLLGPEC